MKPIHPITITKLNFAGRWPQAFCYRFSLHVYVKQVFDETCLIYPNTFAFKHFILVKIIQFAQLSNSHAVQLPIS